MPRRRRTQGGVGEGIQAATVVQTDKVKVNFPLWESDPAVNWLAELGTIIATDGQTGEVEVTPKKVGGISRVSSEAAETATRASPISLATVSRTRLLTAWTQRSWATP